MPLYSFGPFQLDGESRRLSRAAEVISLSDRHIEVLLQLVDRAGAIVSKNALIDSAWGDVAVTDNSLEQAISVLRRALADAAGTSMIETVPRRGYRFIAPVSRSVRRESDETLAALLAPHRAWLEGQTLLETLERERVASAEAAFLRALEAMPDTAQPHVGLANAYVFRFESTRLQTAPAIDALEKALQHAREACRLDPELAEAWATLGFVLSRAGGQDALAASKRAVQLEPDNWRHQLRLAFVGWGEERLRATSRALHLLPGLSLAHFLAATVYVARQSFDAAAREADAGIASQEASRASGDSRFGGVGLHWLRGLLHLRANDKQAARAAFQQELSSKGAGHLYGAECSAQAHYALGAMAWRAGDSEAAAAAFRRALELAAGHVSARAALSALLPSTSSTQDVAGLAQRLAGLRAHGLVVDAAVAAALPDVMRGDHAVAATRVRDALATAAQGPQGWSLPLDPLLVTSSHEDVWAGALAILRTRAA